MAATANNLPDLSAFEGRWALSRVIADQRADKEGHLTGEAVFTPDGPDQLRYAETGTLSYASQPPIAATRVYIWREVPGGIEVLFEDERPFHLIEAGRSMPDANHHCDPDLYHVSYDFTRWPKWSSHWRVVGPRKDYRLVSEYRRTD